MKKRLKITLILGLSLVLLSAGAFFIYVSDYYRASDIAITTMKNDTTMRIKDKNIVLSPAKTSDTALIFYPGGKVEYTAYIPILEKIKKETGITCILIKMPFNLAVFDINAADKVMKQFPEIKNWYIGGHSLGGAMASNYASNHQDKVKGLILLGAYIYGNYLPKNTLTIYGTLNKDVEDKINYTENVVAIKGGNHAQFGNYGKQHGDSDATISTEEQQNTAVEAIKIFLAKRR